MPRTLLAALVALVVGGIAPHLASAGHWWMNGSGNVVHLNRGHFPALSFFNNATNGSATALEHARGEWSANFAVDVYNVSGPADITAWDGYWGATGWAGLATPVTNAAGAGTVHPDGHVDSMWVQVNMSYGVGSSYASQKAIGCQEIGHAIGGQLHDGGGCMGFGYFNFDPNVAAARSPTAHDFDHLQHLWGGLH